MTVSNEQHATHAHAPLRVGLIGAGRIVERVHLPLVAALPGVTVAGIYDPDVARAREVAANGDGGQACRSLEELFALDLDATLVACPNHLHAELTIAALESRIHVLCEKPMATSVAEAEAMVRASEASKRELMIAYTNRFRPEVVALKQAIEAGQLGEIQAIRCGWLRHKGVPGANTWFTSREKAGGGVLMDLGSHLIDLALWLTGHRQLLGVGCAIDRTLEPRDEAEWYGASEATARTACDVDVSASAFAVFAESLNLFVEVSWSCSFPQDQTYLSVVGRRGAARLDTLFGLSPNGQRPTRPLRLWIEGQPVAEQVAGATDLLQPYRKQWEYFVESLRTGRSLRPALHDGLDVVRLIEAMYESAEELESGRDTSHQLAAGKS
jgi:predicted dehydrogenase